MSSQPGGDTSWDTALAHRPPDLRTAIRERFESAGVRAEDVHAALTDGGDELFAAATGGAADWAKRWGGPLAVALLAAEVGAMTAHLTSRSSAIRAVAVEALLDDFSAVTVANRLGVSRQKVYDIARPGSTGSFIDHAPWRLP
jgi:DNA-directed RNA polymerase specialized sigma24 family protein